MNLSPNFTLEEMVSSQEAARNGLDNSPSAKVLENLKITCGHLETVRALLGKPVLISSGYRSIALNTLIGGAKDSAHCLGWAADIIVPGFGSPLRVCQALEGLKAFDQLIFEFEAWTHISFDPRMRREVLSIKTGQGYQPGLEP